MEIPVKTIWIPFSRLYQHYRETDKYETQFHIWVKNNTTFNIINTRML